MAKKANKVGAWISNAVLASNKSQKEIAEEVGYSTPNNISLLKNGSLKLSLNKIKALAKALDADEGQLLRVTLSEYYPELLKLIDDNICVLSANERHLIEQWRTITENNDPAVGTEIIESLEKAVKGS